MRSLTVVALTVALLASGWAFADSLDNCTEHLPFGVPTVSESSTTTAVCHEGYAALVDDEALVPRWVAYHLTGEHTLGCLDRTNNFHADADLPADHRAKPGDYQLSGYDQGHQAPAQDFAWDMGEMRDSFSMANMAPQLPGLNRKEWERLEETVRAWALERDELIVYVGPVLPMNPHTIGTDHVVVPSAFWKVVVDPVRREAMAFLMPQRNIPKGDLVPWETSIATIEATAKVQLPIPEGISRTVVAPLWGADLAGWRDQHRAACLD
jgi:endonuclease G, mitochondrial